jgi:hypothetical protein
MTDVVVPIRGRAAATVALRSTANVAVVLPPRPAPVTHASILLGPLRLSATGTVSGGIVSGSAALPLGPLTLAATGTSSAVTVTGTATLALGPLTTSATSSPVTVSGSAAAPLGPLTVSASGSVTVAPPVPGCTFWLDASNIASAPADGAALSTWNDLSGSGNNFTQSGAARPIYYSSTSAKLINGKPAVWFSGSAQFMSCVNAVAQAQPFAWYIVAKIAGVPNAASYTLFQSPSGSVILQSAITQWDIYAGGSTAHSGIAPDNNTHVHSLRLDATPTFRIDANSAVSLAAGGNAMGGNALLGEQSGGSNYWNGAICEVLVYPGTVSAANDTTIRNYLQAKWAPLPVTGTASLPLGPLTVSASGSVSGGAPTVVQKAAVSYATSPQTVAYASNVTAGNKLIVCAMGDNGIACTVTDSQSNSYTRVQFADTATGRVEIWAAQAGSTGPDTVTITGAAGHSVGAQVYEVSHISLPADTNGTASSGTAIPVVGPTLTCSVTGCFVIHWAVYNPPGNTAVAAPWTSDYSALIAGGHYMGTAYQVAASTSVTGPTIDPGTNSQFSLVAAAFHP